MPNTVTAKMIQRMMNGRMDLEVRAYKLIIW